MAAATALTIASIAATAAGTGMSFMQAGEQQAAQQRAKQDAEKAMEEARKQLQMNYYAAQGIKKEPYALEREALLSAGAQAIQAGVESERGAGAVAGRVLQAQNQAQAGITTAMGQEMTNLENRQLAEQSRLRDQLVGLDLGEVKGAQQAAGIAAAREAQAMQQGFQGLAATAQQSIHDLVPLYLKTSGAQATPTTASTPAFGQVGAPAPTMNQLGIPSVSSVTPSIIASSAAPAEASTMGMQTAVNPTFQPWNFYSNQQNPYAAFYSNPSIGGK